MTELPLEIVRQLEELGVKFAFGYPGGRVMPIMDRLSDTDIQLVRPRDEREASIMADAAGRITGKPAALLGQGPWIGSNGALGQMEARLASTPMIVITDSSEGGDFSTVSPYQQSRGDYGGLDLPAILSGITKEHWSPRTPNETIRTVQLAYKHAVAGRPGPTGIIVDGNAIQQEVPDEQSPPIWEPKAQARTWNSAPTDVDLQDATTALESANRPVIIAGNGVHAAQAYDELQTVAEAYDAAVTTSYLGKSTFPETHELAAGVIGTFGQQGANDVVSEADTLLIVGCRMNPMDTNWLSPTFIRPKEQTIIHADIDERNAGWVYPADVGLIGDAKEVLSKLGASGGQSNDWARSRAESARESFTSAACLSDQTPVTPQRAAKEVERIVDEDTIITADAGNSRFWISNYIQLPDTGMYFGTGGVGCMGWSAPAAVSAAIVTDKDVVSVAGDGGFTMTMTSVETAVEYGVAPTFVVFNDVSLGMVRQGENDIDGQEFPDTNFVQIAEGFGALGKKVTSPDELRSALEEAKTAELPTVIDTRIDREEIMFDELGSSYTDAGGLGE